MSRLTVALLSYNRLHYLPSAIESTLGQTFGDFELLVIDNGSTDGTIACVESYQDPRLRLLVNERNLGAFGSLKRAIELASGDYLYFMHDDDIMEPDNLRRKVEFLDLYPSVAFVHSAFATIDEHDRVMTPCYHSAEPYDTVLPGDLFLRRTLLTPSNPICCPTVMIRREAAVSAGGFDPRLPWSADWEYWGRLAALGDVGYLSDPLYRYRIHGANFSRNFDTLLPAAMQNALCKRFLMRKLGHRFHDADHLLETSMLAHARQAIATAEDVLKDGNHVQASALARLSLWMTPQALPILQSAGLEDLVHEPCSNYPPTLESRP